MKPRHTGLYSYPLGRFYEYLRGGFWNVAELSILEDEFSYADEDLVWAWDQLLWAYWEPRASRRRIKSLERYLVEAFNALPQEAQVAFRGQIVDALCHYYPPCYSPTVLQLAFGTGLSIPLDETVAIKPLDNLRLMARKEYRLTTYHLDPECPCRIAGAEASLLAVLERFYCYVGYRTSEAPPLGRVSPVVALFDHDIDVHDVALVEKSLLSLCRRVPPLYRLEIATQAAKIYQLYPSATLERLACQRDW